MAALIITRETCSSSTGSNLTELGRSSIHNYVEYCGADSPLINLTECHLADAISNQKRIRWFQAAFCRHIWETHLLLQQQGGYSWLKEYSWSLKCYFYFIIVSYSLPERRGHQDFSYANTEYWLSCLLSTELFVSIHGVVSHCFLHYL